jgi:ribosomal protein S25
MKTKEKLTEESLTELEKKALEIIVGSQYAEPGYSDIDAIDVAQGMKMDIKIVRGVIGSLEKKGVISIYENDSKYKIIYLNTNYYHLHPEWDSECMCEECLKQRK